MSNFSSLLIEILGLRGVQGPASNERTDLQLAESEYAFQDTLVVATQGPRGRRSVSPESGAAPRGSRDRDSGRRFRHDFPTLRPLGLERGVERSYDCIQKTVWLEGLVERRGVGYLLHQLADSGEGGVEIRFDGCGRIEA
jgi:hypothetical protein